LALAYCISLSVDRSLGSRSARVGVAGIRLLFAFVASANITHPTVWISLALRLAASDGVWVGGVARLAPADRVPIPVDGALCIWTARSWVAGVRGLSAAERKVAWAPAQAVLKDHRGHFVLTWRTTSIDGAGHRDEAMVAAADGVSLVVD